MADARWTTVVAALLILLPLSAGFASAQDSDSAIRADLSVSTSSGSVIVPFEGTMPLQVTVANRGPDATAAMVAIRLPAGLAFVTSPLCAEPITRTMTVDGVTTPYPSGLVICATPTIAADGAFTIPVAFTWFAESDGAPSVSFVAWPAEDRAPQTTRLYYSTIDRNAANNAKTLSFQTAAQEWAPAVLGISMSHSPASAAPGTPVDVTATVPNTGGSPSAAATLTLSGSNGAFSSIPRNCRPGVVVTCSLNVPAGETSSLAFKFTATPGTKDNLAAVFGTVAWDDGNGAVKTASAGTQIPVTLPKIEKPTDGGKPGGNPNPGGADSGDEETVDEEETLKPRAYGAKFNGPAKMIAGETGRYTFVLTPAGAGEPAEVTSSIELSGPGKFTSFKSIDGTDACQLGETRAVCTWKGAGAVGATFEFKASEAGDIVATASEPTFNTQIAPVKTEVMKREADLVLTQLEASNANPSAGQEITIKFSVMNNGPAPVKNAHISTVVPDGANLGVDSKGPCVIVGKTVTCFLGTIAPGATASASVPFTPDAPGSYGATVTAAAGIPDPDTSNNSRSLVVTVGA